MQTQTVLCVGTVKASLKQPTPIQILHNSLAQMRTQWATGQAAYEWNNGNHRLDELKELPLIRRAKRTSRISGTLCSDFTKCVCNHENHESSRIL